MGKPVLPQEVVQNIVRLRKMGATVPEIHKQLGHSKSTIFRYVQNVPMSKEGQLRLQDRKRPSVYRSKHMWEKAKAQASVLIGNNFSNRDYAILLAGLYWGEGTKQELNLINGDPHLVKVFLEALYRLGVHKDDVRVTIRIFGQKTRDISTAFWLKELQLSHSHIVGYEIIPPKPYQTRLPHGMCRIRVRRGQLFFKTIMSMIDLLGGTERMSR